LKLRLQIFLSIKQFYFLNLGQFASLPSTNNNFVVVTIISDHQLIGVAVLNDAACALQRNSLCTRPTDSVFDRLTLQEAMSVVDQAHGSSAACCILDFRSLFA
jgi:hypothetical protein